MKSTAHKTGDRVAVDVSCEAFYKLQGIKKLYGIFVEKTSKTEYAVKIDGAQNEEIREASAVTFID